MLLSSTVMTPSLPTLSMASAIISPIWGSAAEIDAVAAICSLVSTSLASASSSAETASTAFSMPRLSAIGLAPAATLRRPSRTSAWASTVAVVVPSPATSSVFLATSLTSSAPIFSYGSSSSISLAMRDAVVGDGGGAPLLLQHDVAALGAEGDPDGIGEHVHAPLETAASLFIESDDLGHSGGSSHANRRWRPGGARDGRAGCRRLTSPGHQTLTGPVRIVTLMGRVLTPLLALSGGECKRQGAPWAPRDGVVSARRR